MIRFEKVLYANKNKNKIPENIRFKNISKTVNIKNKICDLTIKNAIFGDVEGKEVLLDEINVTQTLREITESILKNSSKYNPVPKKIIIEHEENRENKDNTIKKNAEFIDIYEPKYSIEDVYLEEAQKKNILTALSISKHKETLFNKWGLKSTIKNGRSIVLNFFGPPGTGKSMTAEAIANYLNKKVFFVNYSELESKYVGETPKNIKKSFELAKENDAVIIFDEADSFLGKRLTNVNQSADYGVNITRSVMLLELERFDGIVIFTTNLIDNYDEAFKRRILANVEFKLPDRKGRELIWSSHMPIQLPLEKKVNYRYLSKQFSNISGADIKDIVLYAAVICIQREGQYLSIDDFQQAYEYVSNRYKSTTEIKITNEIITEKQYNKETQENNKVI